MLHNGTWTSPSVSVLHPTQTPLWFCWSSGIVTVSSLRWPRCRSSHWTFVFPCRLCSSLCCLPLQQSTVRVKWVKVEKELVLRGRRVTALFAHVKLVASLLVGVLECDTVDLLHVRLQWASLSEGLVAQSALVRTNSCGGKWRSQTRNSPVCVCVCVCMLQQHWRRIPLLRSVVQLPVWVRTCLFRSKVSLKPFPQKVHKCLLVSLWHLMCLFNIRWWWKLFWQIYRQAHTMTTSLHDCIHLVQEGKWWQERSKEETGSEQLEGGKWGQEVSGAMTGSKRIDDRRWVERRKEVRGKKTARDEMR